MVLARRRHETVIPMRVVLRVLAFATGRKRFSWHPFSPSISIREEEIANGYLVVAIWPHRWEQEPSEDYFEPAASHPMR